MKWRKKTAALLAAIMMLMAPVTVMADSIDTSSNKPYISLGADLNSTEMETVLQLLGVSEEELSNYTVVKITNSMEHEYLDSYMSSSLIGSRALSSVLVRGEKEGYGIKVTTKNISYCTVGMYQNALATAGITNADITVVGPFKISGTAGLVGVIKAYENMTGEQVDEEKVEAATNELVVTSDIAENIGDSEKAEELVGFIKNEVASNDYTEEEMSALVDEAASEMQVSLSDEDKQNILDLMDKVKGLDIDVTQLQEQVEGLYSKLQGMDLHINLDSEETKSFLSNLWDKIVGFFNDLLG
ncbi:MAG: DUF1002 domain-containing protein [Lachnospiraceae bacterium]|nr:DUF1002 domain-containing protein [Lachnospiraceae bacterium]MDY4771480.1 DUF1002 domain-containing protein [Lachnospiraceae bacterium]